MGYAQIPGKRERDMLHSWVNTVFLYRNRGRSAKVTRTCEKDSEEDRLSGWGVPACWFERVFRMLKSASLIAVLTSDTLW
jgi:hypothetical protein